MEKNWVCIFTTDKIHQAEIAKGVLEENNIESVVINKKDSNYLFGYVEVYVNRDDAISGKHILRNFENTD